MRVDVRLAGALRPHARGVAVVAVAVPDEAATLRAVLDALAQDYPAIDWRIRNELGALRPHVNLFIGEEPARDHGGLDATVPDGATVIVLPAVSGGGQ